MYVLNDFHRFLENPIIVRLLKEISLPYRDICGKTIVMISPAMDLPLELEKEVVMVDAPLPDSREIFDFITKAIDNLMKAGVVTKVVFNKKSLMEIIRNLKGLTLNQIDNLLSMSVVEHERIDPVYLKKKKIKMMTDYELVTMISPADTIGLSALGGFENVKDWLKLRKDFFIVRSQGGKGTITANEYNIPIPKGILVTGIQGCGKTHLVKCLAKEWDIPLLWLDMGKIFASRVGESEERMREALKIAERMEPCILLIDEFEKGFSGLQSSGLTDGGTSARVISYFLVWMQERTKRVFIVATTNDVESIPPELIRQGRFDERFFVDLPNQEEREEIFRLCLSRHNLGYAHVHVKDFAERCVGFSGAEIEQVIVDSLYSAYGKQRIPQQSDMYNAISRTVPLSQTRCEDIDRLRKWALKRFVPASIQKQIPEQKILDFQKMYVKATENR